jgi:hypothetical protein
VDGFSCQCGSGENRGKQQDSGQSEYSSGHVITPDGAQKRERRIAQQLNPGKQKTEASSSSSPIRSRCLRRYGMSDRQRLKFGLFPL